MYFEDSGDLPDDLKQRREAAHMTPLVIANDTPANTEVME
jgi:hypothetical protein